jgi:hypothetical protein
MEVSAIVYMYKKAYNMDFINDRSILLLSATYKFYTTYFRG